MHHLSLDDYAAFPIPCSGSVVGFAVNMLRLIRHSGEYALS